MVLISFNNSFASKLKGWSTKSVTSFMSLFSTLFLSSIFFNLFKSPSFLSSSLNPLLNILPYEEISNFTCSTVLGLRTKSLPVKYSALIRFLKTRADIIAVSLSKWCCASFYLIFLSNILIWSVTVISYKVSNNFFLNLKGLR